MLQRTLRITVLSVLVLFTISVESAGDCETPKKQPGTCLPIESCPILKDLAESSNRNSETILYLQNSICGYNGAVPKLCCPVNTTPKPVLTPKPIPDPPKPTPSPLPPRNGNSDEPVDVSLSPRLSMLPFNVCGIADQGKVIGGTKAKVNEFPWMAVLGYFSTVTNEIGFKCGGTIINNRYVLTAAHCVTGLQSTQKLVTVRLGELNLSNATDCSEIKKKTICAPPVEDYGIEEIIPHVNFSLTRLTDDIALIRLNQTITFKSHIQPICLPVGTEQKRNLESGRMIVSGWGIYEEGIQSPHLLSVFVPLSTHASCSKTYASKSNIQISASRQVCAGGKGNADSCTGDSGGPLKFYGEVKVTTEDGISSDQRIVQFGIVSFGPRVCASESIPGVYTRVGYYMDWILHNLKS